MLNPNHQLSRSLWQFADWLIPTPHFELKTRQESVFSNKRYIVMVHREVTTEKYNTTHT